MYIYISLIKPETKLGARDRNNRDRISKHSSSQPGTVPGQIFTFPLPFPPPSKACTCETRTAAEAAAAAARGPSCSVLFCSVLSCPVLSCPVFPRPRWGVLITAFTHETHKHKHKQTPPVLWFPLPNVQPASPTTTTYLFSILLFVPLAPTAAALPPKHLPRRPPIPAPDTELAGHLARAVRWRRQWLVVLDHRGRPVA